MMTIDEPERDACCWCVVIKLQELPELLRCFQNRLPHTREIEQQATRLVASGFQVSELRQFINAVCKWGGYSGVAGRVIKIENNAEPELRSRFRSAYSDLVAQNDVAAIKRLLELKGLTVSFASKHLKFLAPDRAVVLDSVISARLGYAMTPEGYQAFVNDCRRILDRVVADNLEYPGWGAKGWRISDVEMAIYEKLRRP
jgi:hypothetical protein